MPFRQVRIPLVPDNVGWILRNKGLLTSIRRRGCAPMRLATVDCTPLTAPRTTSDLPVRPATSPDARAQAVMAEWVATFMFLFNTIGCVVFTQDG